MDGWTDRQMDVLTFRVKGLLQCKISRLLKFGLGTS